MSFDAYVKGQQKAWRDNMWLFGERELQSQFVTDNQVIPHAVIPNTVAPRRSTRIDNCRTKALFGCK